MKRKAFTLVELLVAIGIIALLAGIAIPVAYKAQKSARGTRIEADLRTIAMGLEAYKQDFRDYPRPPINDANPVRGSVALSEGLLAPGGALVDGKDGPGFKTKRASVNVPTGTYTPDGEPIIRFDRWLNTWNGMAYGPYVQPDKFSASAMDGTGHLTRDGSPIAYYVAAKRQNATAAGSFVNDSLAQPSPVWSVRDNAQWVPSQLLITITKANADGSRGAEGLTAEFLLVATTEGEDQPWTMNNTIRVSQ
jgi:prepilin-type N-terminal cleavage/methylation domain-containing protein